MRKRLGLLYALAVMGAPAVVNADGAGLPVTRAGATAGEELLVNGDFEAEGQKGSDTEPVLGWLKPLGGPASKYDGRFQPPPGDLPDEPNGYNQETDNRGSVDARGEGPVTARIMQTVSVLPQRKLSLAGFMWANSAQVVVNHHVRILDGNENGDTLAEFVRESGSFVDWTAFSLVGTPTGPLATVDWGFVNTSSDWNDAAATHVDQMSLTQAKDPCHDPFADSDEDGDVDQEDFAVWQICVTQTGVAAGAPGDPADCVCLDVNDNGQINGADLAAFEVCASGPDVPADPCCDGGPGCP